MKDLTPFDFMNAASFSKEDLIRNSDIPEHTEKMYTPYVVNRGFTNFEDTILPHPPPLPIASLPLRIPPYQKK